MSSQQQKATIFFGLFIFCICFFGVTKSASSSPALCEKCLQLCRKAHNVTLLRSLCWSCIPRCTGQRQTISSFFSNHLCTHVQDTAGNNRSIPFEQFQPIADLFSRSATPTTPTPTPSIEPEDPEGNCKRFHRAMSSAFTNYIVNSLQTCSDSLKFERERLRNCTIKSKSAILSEEAVIEVYSSRLTNATSAERLLQEPSSNDTEERNRLAATRSFAGIRGSQATNQEICPTRIRVISPRTVRHPSGVDVQLWVPKGKRQLFFVRDCKSSTPLIGLTSGTGRCSMVNNLHKALFVYETARKTRRVPFSGCTRISKKGARKSKLISYVCDEWVLLPTFCTLYVSGSPSTLL